MNTDSSSLSLQEDNRFDYENEGAMRAGKKNLFVIIIFTTV